MWKFSREFRITSDNRKARERKKGAACKLEAVGTFSLDREQPLMETKQYCLT